jgi:hypothetical protein
MAEKIVTQHDAPTWEDVFATFPKEIQALYNSFIEAQLAEIASTRKERDALKKEVQEIQKKRKI